MGLELVFRIAGDEAVERLRETLGERPQGAMDAIGLTVRYQGTPRRRHP